jgi:hypothetical protein
VIKALEVIWIFDKAIHPKKWKMAVASSQIAFCFSGSIQVIAGNQL